MYKISSGYQKDISFHRYQYSVISTLWISVFSTYLFCSLQSSVGIGFSYFSYTTHNPNPVQIPAVTDPHPTPFSTHTSIPYIQSLTFHQPLSMCFVRTSPPIFLLVLLRSTEFAVMLTTMKLQVFDYLLWAFQTLLEFIDGFCCM
jgi:hypothetical protein